MYIHISICVYAKHDASVSLLSSDTELELMKFNFKNLLSTGQ